MSVSREVIYSVAMSLDGFMAGPGGECDRIPLDDLGIDTARVHPKVAL